MLHSIDAMLLRRPPTPIAAVAAVAVVAANASPARWRQRSCAWACAWASACPRQAQPLSIGETRSRRWFSSSSSSSHHTTASDDPHAPLLLFTPYAAPKHATAHLSLDERERRARDIQAHLHSTFRARCAHVNPFADHLRVAIDLAFCDHMTSIQVRSLARQLLHIYGANRRAPAPAQLHLLNWRDAESLRRSEPSSEPSPESPEPSPESPEPSPESPEPSSSTSHAHAPSPTSEDRTAELFRVLDGSGAHSWLVHRSHTLTPLHATPSELVYLSPDAADVLWALDPSHVYCIAGLVDQTVKSTVSLDYARKARTRACRLPIKETIPFGLRKTALNVDTVVALLTHVYAAAHPRPPERWLPRSLMPPSGDEEEHAARSESAAAAPLHSLQSHFPIPLRGRINIDSAAAAPIDWPRLWRDAFEAIIPARLRWDEAHMQRRSVSSPSSSTQLPPIADR